MEDIKLVDENNQYLFSYLYEIDGKDIDVMQTKRAASIAGTPAYVCIMLAGPPMISIPPNKDIMKGKRYKVIVIECEK